MAIDLANLRQQLDDELYYGPTESAPDLCLTVERVIAAYRSELGDFANVLQDRAELVMFAYFK